MQHSIDSDEERLLTGLHITSQSSSPHQTSANADDNTVDIQSSSTPAVNPHPSQSTLDGVEQEFVPLIDADGELHRVGSSHAEDVLIKKIAGLEKPLAKNSDSHHLFADNSKVKNDHVAGSEAIKQIEKEFDGDEDKEDEDDDDDVDDAEMDEEDEGDDDDAVDNSNNANINTDIGASTEEQLDEIKDVDAESKGGIAPDSSQPVDPAAGINEQSSSAVNLETAAESGFSDLRTQDDQPVTQQPAVSSDDTKLERDSNRHSDVNVRQLRHSEVDKLSYSSHTGKDFSQWPAETTDHRGHWHQDNQAHDMRFHPSEFDRHLHHGAHPSMVWKHGHSSPVEEYRNNWPEMQEAYRSWPELMHEQRYHMNHMTDDRRFIHHDQKHFVNQHLDNRWSRVSPEDDYYLQNQRARSSQFYGQNPNLVISRWPNEDPNEHVRYRDMLNNQQHQDRRYRYQEPDVHQPHFHVDQVYQQHPHGQRYMSSIDDKNSYSGRVEPVSSVSGGKQAARQPEFSALDEEHSYSADKSQFNMPHIGHGSQKPSSVQFSEKDVPLAEDLARPLQVNNQPYQRDAHVSSLPQKYIDDGLQAPAPVLGGRVDESVPSISSVKQAAPQPEFSAVDEEQQRSADKSQFDMPRVGQRSQMPSSDQFSEKDVQLAEDLARPLQANNQPYQRDADVSSLSQKYIEDALQPPAPVLGGTSGHMSGE